MILKGQKETENFGMNFAKDLRPGSVIALIGPLGAGKTTFLKLITGELRPDAGEIRVASTVQFNYVDQSKEVLSESKSIIEEIGCGVSTVQLGRETISVRSYLRRFLFDEKRVNTRIDRLSGGEKARLALAKAFLRGGNFLLLDEPTNDLDLSSLRLLEEALLSFNGCLIIVSHDRYFLNRVATHILGFDGRGGSFFTPGDYDYYLEKRNELAARTAEEEKKSAPSSPATRQVPAPGAPKTKKKLTWKEERELEGMESAIEEAEKKVAGYETLFSSPDFFSAHGADAPKLKEEFEEAQKRVACLYARWEELEKKAAADN